MNIPRILIVDDELRVPAMLRFGLGRSGLFHIREENDPSHAVATARSFKPDVVVLKVPPPQKNHCDVSRQIESDPTLHGVPIVRFATMLPVEKPFHRSGVLFFNQSSDANRLIEVITQILARRHALCMAA
jgi:CheY-like chemotaxis protein